MDEGRPYVFVVDDDRCMRESLHDLLRAAGLTVQMFASAHEFLTSQRPEAPSCSGLDIQLPGLSGLDLQQELAKVHAPMSIICITGYGDIPMTVRAMQAGALDFLTKPFRDEDLLTAVAQALHHGQQMVSNTHTPAAETPDTADDRRSDSHCSEIVGHSAALRRVLHQVALVASTDATVLLYDETGTGKELLARALHTLRTRRAQAFVKLNCAAIPTGLLESELFGHEKGTFTGALAQRLGRFELAQRGPPLPGRDGRDAAGGAAQAVAGAVRARVRAAGQPPDPAQSTEPSAVPHGRALWRRRTCRSSRPSASIP